MTRRSIAQAVPPDPCVRIFRRSVTHIVTPMPPETTALLNHRLKLDGTAAVLVPNCLKFQGTPKQRRFLFYGVPFRRETGVERVFVKLRWEA